jgi:hypothetical protein
MPSRASDDSLSRDPTAFFPVLLLCGIAVRFGAAAVAGEAGVLHAIALLAREIDIDMALLGLRRIGDARRDMLRPASAKVEPTAPSTV